jgi:quinol monooxygenase YgiN
MYMRVTRGKWADTGMLDSEAVAQVLQDLFAAVRGLPGNESYTGGQDRASGQTIAVSIWDTEEHAKALSGTSAIAARLQALGLMIEPSEFFEVRTPT